MDSAKWVYSGSNLPRWEEIGPIIRMSPPARNITRAIRSVAGMVVVREKALGAKEWRLGWLCLESGDV